MAEITTDTKIPALETLAAGSGSSGATGEGDKSTKQTGGCPVHHSAKPSGFATLYTVSTGDFIKHQNANTVKFALRSLSKGFDRPSSSSHGKIYSTPPSFTAAANKVIRFNEWNQLRNTLVQFGANTLDAIAVGTTINASFFGQLKAQYDHYKGLCLCNSDCGCNSVCSCNSDCGCDY